MRYRIVTVGRLKEPFYKSGLAHYLSRLQALAQCEVVEVREGKGDRANVQRSEGALLLAASDGYLVALDEAGTQLTTRGLAQHVTNLELAGHSRVCLLIAGAEGHGPEVKAAANALWSLSPLTFPHDLARLVLIEQLYRVETVRAGHPYHRD